MSNKINNFRKVERIVKGFASHRRIQILELLKQKPELSVMDISRELKIDFRTVAEHIRKLTISGLVMKRADGPAVRHKLTNLGIAILMFCRTLE